MTQQRRSTSTRPAGLPEGDRFESYRGDNWNLNTVSGQASRGEAKLFPLSLSAPCDQQTVLRRYTVFVVTKGREISACQ